MSRTAGPEGVAPDDAPRSRARVALAVVAALVGGPAVGALHELGHFVPGIVFDWSPSISFAQGGSCSYAARPPTPLPAHEMLALAGGPLMTFGLAALGALLLRSFHGVLAPALLVFTVYNAVFRFSVFIDGSGADEAKMSALVGSAHIFETASVLSSFGLVIATLASVGRFPRPWWSVGVAVPAFALLAVSYVVGMRILAALFG